MKIINVPFQCPCCQADLVVQVDTFTAQHKVLDTWKAKPRDAYVLVQHYKKLKGYDKLPTWDQQYKGRAFKVAGKILRFFRKLEDPVGVGMELINDTSQAAKAGDWAWTFETCIKRADDWILKKSQGK